MAYVKNTWVDQAGQIRYEQTTDEDDLIILTPNYELITEIGTPVNATNMNHIEDGIADCDTALGQKVSKTGDTMSGNLTIAKNSPNLSLKDTGLDFATAPSANRYSNLSRLLDANNVILGEVQHEYKTDTSHAIFLQSRKSATENTTYSTIRVGWDANGNSYCTFPNTTCCDGQWVVSGTNVADNVSLPIGTDQRLEYNISSILPNDGYNYMVLISVDIETGSGSGASVVSSVIGKDYNGNDVWTRVSNLTARGSWIMTGASNVIIPVNSSRKIWLNYSVYSKIAKLNSLFLEAFRRIGTNG